MEDELPLDMNAFDSSLLEPAIDPLLRALDLLILDNESYLEAVEDGSDQMFNTDNFQGSLDVINKALSFELDNGVELHSKRKTKKIMSNKIPITIEIDPQLEKDLIITAYEGGSSYWAYLTNKTLDEIDAIVSPKSGLAPSERLYDALQVGKSFDVNDADDDPKEVLGTISKESLAKAWNLITGEQYVHHFHNIISGNWDAESADVFFQLAVLGEVVYG